ncbi:MAG: 30S ribosomal protein S4 [Symbiobacteriaceae bacterium]|nr:30S ribosomal protein S4 [Symbiobacteriaceae bacterium]
MARYTGPVCRLCRREGVKLFLKTDRCFTGKCSFDRRPTPPGQHGQGRRSKQTDYGLHLREKQKTRRIYGVLEGQFRGYFVEAKRRKGVTGEQLLRILESRLDNIVFRLGFAGNRIEARQLVRHGHFLVNNRRVDIPSFQCKAGDVIALASKSRDSLKFKSLIDNLGLRPVPAWLQLDQEGCKGTVLHLPARDEIDVQVAEHLIVELYSR